MNAGFRIRINGFSIREESLQKLLTQPRKFPLQSPTRGGELPALTSH